MLWLKQSTAVTIQLGPFVDITDGVTPETGLATNMDNATTGIRVSKNGAASADRNSATAPSHDDDGYYRVELDTTDTNALGTLHVQYEEVATCLPAWKDFMVLPANVWDSLFGADNLQVDMTQIVGGAVPAPTTTGVPDVNIERWLDTLVTLGAGAPDVNVASMDANSIAAGVMAANSIAVGIIALNAITSAQIEDNALSGAKFAADAIAKIADGVFDEDIVAAHGTADTAGLLIRALGALISQRSNNPTLNAILGVPDTAGEDVPSTTTDEVLDEDLSTHTTANTAGQSLGDQALAAASIIPGTVDSTGFTMTNTEFEADDITEATADHYKGRVVVWTSGALIGQAAEITVYALATGRGHFTITPPNATDIPANNDTFIII